MFAVEDRVVLVKCLSLWLDIPVGSEGIVVKVADNGVQVLFQKGYTFVQTIVKPDQIQKKEVYHD